MYIVFEGIDDSGKSTQIELVKERLIMEFNTRNLDLQKIGFEVISECELAETLLDDDYKELVLRFALQRYLLHEPIPESWFNDDNPEIVLSDRSYYSSLAYQGWVGKDAREWIGIINSKLVHEPAMVFFFDNGDSDDLLKHNAYQTYFKVLPLNTVYVNTENHTIAETTEYITNKILNKWENKFKMLK